MTTPAAAAATRGDWWAGPLADRLQEVAGVLGYEPQAAEPDPALLASRLLEAAVHAVHKDLQADRMWLLLVAVGAAFPAPDLVLEGMRHFALANETEATVWLLQSRLGSLRQADALGRRVRLAVGAVLVEADHTARSDLHTGIQQVIRRTIPLWARAHRIEVLAWTRDGEALRSLEPAESDRVLAWWTGRGSSVPVSAAEDLVVPWRSVLVVPDVVARESVERLAACAEYSGNRVVGIGHDCIPVVSPHLVPPGSANPFVLYLSVVKHMRRVAAVSQSAADEFGGFVDALPTQGLTGPVVVVCPLGSDPPQDAGRTEPVGPPLVVQVGSFEPRKNHLAVLFAAEVLWREGVKFRLSLVGGMAWATDVVRRVEELQALGRPVEMAHGVSHDELERTYCAAAFTVFPSLHEGYGLPVAESLAAGTPVVASAFGATAERAEAGGVLLVDPRDDASLAAGMRTLLTVPGELSRLREEASHRPVRYWEQYAAELWELIVAPELAELAGAADRVTT